MHPSVSSLIEEGGENAVVLEKVIELFGDVEIYKGGTMGITDTLNKQGFKPKANTDQDFPPIKGEYEATCMKLEVIANKETQAKESILASWQIARTLSGDVADGRYLSRFYRFAGNNFDGSPISEDQVNENLKKLGNDFFTMGVDLDFNGDSALEASFEGGKGKACFIRAWHFSPKSDPDRSVQQFVIKQEKDLKKESKEPSTERSPF